MVARIGQRLFRRLTGVVLHRLEHRQKLPDVCRVDAHLGGHDDVRRVIDGRLSVVARIKTATGARLAGSVKLSCALGSGTPNSRL